MAFMVPEYTKEPMWLVETNYGTEVVPADLLPKSWQKHEIITLDEHPEDTFGKIYDYIEGAHPSELSLVKNRWWARLSAPGYMDKTDWHGPFSTKKQAEEEIETMYDVDPKTGEPLEENPRRRAKKRSKKATKRRSKKATKRRSKKATKKRTGNPRPEAYDPQPGYKWQILCRNQAYSRAWEHCDYAKDRAEKKHLIDNYRQAYGAGWEFQSILLPMKYWPKAGAATNPRRKTAKKRSKKATKRKRNPLSVRKLVNAALK